jgi:tRNA(Ile)-lysidine synthase
MASLGLAGGGFAVGLSGGGDSVALLLLLSDWARASGAPPPTALIVDHGLRPESAAEAAEVAAWARACGVAAEVLRWGGRKPAANIEDAARAARYRQMGTWCQAQGCATLFVGHSRDDQAETFLLRLGRGSGVDGLSAMPPLSVYPVPGFAGLRLARPLLAFDRAELRADLAARGVAWREDPMNGDPRFARSKIRALLPLLAEAGLPAARIAAAAGHLARARTALEADTDAFLKAHSRADGEGALLDGEALRRVPEEIGLRALAQLLMQVSGAGYRPRFERLQSLYAVLTAENPTRGRTLHGCRVGPAAKRFRELGPGTLAIRPEAVRKARTKVQIASETAHSEARLRSLTVS